MAEPFPAVDESVLTGTAGLDPRTFWTLLAGNALTMVGIGFFLPILPLVVAGRGGSSVQVGLIFAAGVGARALAQYPAGRLSDRVGRRPVIVVSLLLYSVMFPLYLIHMPPAALIGLRFVHAFGSAAYAPAAGALVADLTGAGERGRAFSRLRASDMVGLVLGPALGGAVAGIRLDAVFVAGAAICLVAALLMLGLPRSSPMGAEEAVLQPSEPARGAGFLRLGWLLLPVLPMAMATAWVFGTYDSVWSLYITSRGATPFLVGLSFATYGLPIVLFAGLAAGLTDRLGPVRAGTLAVLTYGLLASTYPFVASVPALILIGFAEGALTAAGNPALQAEASRLAPAGAQGRTQGVFQTGLSGAQVLGSIAGGLLFAVRPAFAFFGCTAACLLGVAGSWWLRRSRAAGAA